ncbi:MAG TPA: WYL domain-containing protein [Frankiaceae bacterium]|nr:WYL domain-containing protein [Frankiaceae bacterium]
MRDQLTAAIQQRKIVTFTYQGHERRVQPAAFGVGNRKGKETLHAYQVGGGSRRGGVPHWRNFHVEGITALTVLDEVFGPNPPGFNPTPFPQTQVALAASPSASATTAPSGGSGGDKKKDEVIPGLPISGEQAAKAVETASKALGKLGKWFRSR